MHSPSPLAGRSARSAGWGRIQHLPQLWYNRRSCPGAPHSSRGSSWSLYPMACTGLSSRMGPRSWPTLPIAPAPTSRGSSPVTKSGSSWRRPIGRGGGLERSVDEGSSVGQEDVSELQGDQAERGCPRDLLEDAQTQTAARLRS